MAGLLEAFRAIAPQTGDPEPDCERNRAARLLLGELRKLTWSTALLQSLPPTDHDELVAVVLLRMVQAGPRGARVGDPGDDDAVRRYLRTALQNAGRDLLRSRKRPDAPAARADTDEPPVSDASPEVQVDRRRAAAGLQQAVCDLYAKVLPRITQERRSDAAQRVRESADELLALYQGTLCLEQLLPDRDAPLGPADRKRARQALYQKYHRALEAMGLAAVALERDGALSDAALRALQTLLGELRLRKDGEQ